MKSPPAAVRPTSDRVRGAVFNVLEARGVAFDRMLDVFAGSGALGIEALSRGEGECDFVENNGAAAAVIRENLSITGLAERGHVHQVRAEDAVRRLTGPYSLIFADPPYRDEAAVTIVGELAGSSLIGQDATLVFEHSSRQDTPDRLGNLRLDWSRRYGDTQVSMYQEEGS